MFVRRAITTLATLAILYTGAATLLRAEDVKAEKKPASCIPAEKDKNRHEQFMKDKEAQLKAGPIQVVFDGDSITDGWRGGGKKVWDKEFGKYNPLNLGIGGDRTQHLLWRNDHNELDG